MPPGSQAGCSKFQQRKSLFYHFGRPLAGQIRMYVQEAQRRLVENNPAVCYELLGLAIDGLAELEDLGSGIYRKTEAEKKQEPRMNTD